MVVWNWSGPGQGRGSSTGSSRGRSSKTHQKIAFSRRGKLKMVVLELVRAGAGSRAAARAAAGAGVPKPPKNRFFKVREAQNGGFRAGAAAEQQHGQQQGQQLTGSAIKKCTPDSREGSRFLISTCSVKKVPRPWSSNVVFLK